MIFDMKLKTSLPVIWLENIDLKNPGRSVRNEHAQLILIQVDPVDDEDVEEIRVLRLLVLQLTMRSKENGRILTLIRSIDHHFFLLYIGFGNWLIQIILQLVIH